MHTKTSMKFMEGVWMVILARSCGNDEFKKIGILSFNGVFSKWKLWDQMF